MNTRLVTTLSLLAISNIAVANPIEDQIRFRQSAYSFLGWNTGKIKAQVSDHPETFNADQIQAAANAVAAVANSGLLSLYAPGSEVGSGWKPTRLKAEFFEKQDEVKEIEANFIKEANQLQQVAAGADIAAIKSQFGKVGATCKSCHDLIRTRE